jgi:DNA-binding NarL/FixJ family response regulator
MIRVVIGEDSYIVRQGLGRVLAAGDEIEVVGEADSYDGVVDAIERLAPDVLVTDIRMPPTLEDEGVRLAAHLRATHPSVGVVLLSQFTSPDFALRLFEGGSEGRAYLLKDHVASQSQLAGAVVTVAAGGTVVDPAVVQVLVASRSQQPNSRLSELTPRETEVLSLVAEGRSNTAIGSALFLSKGAVEKHINSIFRKLNMPDESVVHRRVYASLVFLADSPRD